MNTIDKQSVNINFPLDQIEAAINATMQKAVTAAAASYGVREAIENKLAEAASFGLISQAVDKALEHLDISQLTQSIADEMQRNVASMVGIVVRDAMAEVVLKLRGVSEYDKAARERAREQLIAGAQRKEQA